MLHIIPLSYKISLFFCLFSSNSSKKVQRNMSKLSNQLVTCQSIWLHTNCSWLISKKPVFPRPGPNEPHYTVGVRKTWEVARWLMGKRRRKSCSSFFSDFSLIFVLVGCLRSNGLNGDFDKNLSDRLRCFLDLWWLYSVKIEGYCAGWKDRVVNEMSS